MIYVYCIHLNSTFLFTLFFYFYIIASLTALHTNKSIRAAVPLLSMQRPGHGGCKGELSETITPPPPPLILTLVRSVEWWWWWIQYTSITVQCLWSKLERVGSACVRALLRNSTLLDVRIIMHWVCVLLRRRYSLFVTWRRLEEIVVSILPTTCMYHPVLTTTQISHYFI